ncbi:zinc finger protein 558-like isoform X2 [Pleurodeles waltl]|uniref:zinc finger protein 558-like isoform X2 n=1 Tax=Pleurodeles waltl TaxID=8319 RepID=UPI0037098146
MRGRKELYQQASEEAPLTFCDVAACFSDEEWELLQRWQKELYKNVMKEIQLAFSSLGPLIANSVFSLRPKEKEDLCSEELQDVEKSINVDPSTNHMTADSDVLFIGNQFVKDTRVTAVKEQGDSPSTELGVVTGGSPDGINADGETRSTAIQAYRTRESWSSLSGNGSMKRNMSNSFKYHEKPTIFKSLAQKRKVNMAQSVYEKTHSNSQMPPASSQEQRGEKSAEWQRVCIALQKSTSCEWRLNKSCESTVKNSSILCESTTQQSSKPYMHADSGQTSQKTSYSQYHQAHNVKGRYACTECGKSFGAMSNLLIHRRIHTGERPYHCTVCGKSFNQIGAFHRHQKMHTGERLHRCTVCGKGFNRKDHLQVHQKIHSKMGNDCEFHLVEIM